MKRQHRKERIVWENIIEIDIEQVYIQRMGGSSSVGSQEGSISRRFFDRVDESQST